MFQVISEKTCSKDFTRNLRETFIENNHKSNYYKFSYKFAYIPVLPFRRNQKQKLNFQEVGDLVMRNTSAFCLRFKGMPNSLEFYKRIFLHVIPSFIIVPCADQLLPELFLFLYKLVPKL